MRERAKDGETPPPADPSPPRHRPSPPSASAPSPFQAPAHVLPGRSHCDATRIHEERVADLLGAKPGHRVLGVGCGVGEPMRAIAVHSGQVTTPLYHADDPAHVEAIHDIERGDALPGLRRQDEIASIAQEVGFEVVQELDLALPSSLPWWTRFKMGRLAYWLLDLSNMFSQFNLL